MTAAAAEPPVVVGSRLSRVRDRLPTRRSMAAVIALAVVLGAVAVIRFGLSLHAVIGVFFAFALLLLTATDLERREIPNVFVLPAAVIALGLEALAPHHLLVHVIAGLALGGAFFLLAALYPAGLGMGDAKLALLLGLVLGSLTPAALLVTSLAVFVGAVAILARRGRAARRSTLPFAPYLALGALLVFFVR
jgi:leader peptidase (prepilin peptidase)/N-methyltransferase